MSGSVPARRVWQHVSVAAVDGGFGILLDDRPLHTPARARLSVPNRRIAEAVAAEWAAQGDRVDPESLPLTRLANTAQDRVAQAAVAVIDELAGYGATDLLCYRAPHPEALVARQAAAWDGPLDWVRRRHGAALVCAAGVMHVPQPAESLGRLRSAVEAHSAAHGPLGLAALAELVALSGSLVLGLAVADGALTGPEGWAASRVDETFQIEQWGEDAEASAMAQRREAAFMRAAWLCTALAADLPSSPR